MQRISQRISTRLDPQSYNECKTKCSHSQTSQTDASHKWSTQYLGTFGKGGTTPITPPDDAFREGAVDINSQ